MTNKRTHQLAEALGMHYCDRDCPCGGDSQLLYTPMCGKAPEWLPGWANGCDPESIYNWAMKEAAKEGPVRTAMANAGFRLPRLED